MVLKNIRINWKPVAALAIAGIAAAAKTRLPDELVDSAAQALLDYLELGAYASVFFMDRIIKK